MKREIKRHRILFIDSGKGYGGPTKFLFYLLSYLDRRKFEPWVAFYYHNDGSDTKKIQELGVPVVFLKGEKAPAGYVPVKWLCSNSGPGLLRKVRVMIRFPLRMVLVEIPLALRIKRFIEKEAIKTVVLNNDVHYHIAGTIGARIAGSPCICRKAGGVGEGKKIKKLLTPHVKLFVAISRATEEDQRMNNPATKRLVTVYEGIDLRIFSPQVRNHAIKRELGIPASRKVVCNLSRFGAGKGQSEYLEAAALVVQSYPEVVFLMVGDGELTAALKKQAERLRIADHVIFTSWRNDIPAVLSAIDIFVHCPTTFIEGLGIANLEAMAMAKPSVVSDNGGLPDAVIHGVTGFVVPPGNVEELSGALLSLLKDDKLAAGMGMNARKRIEDKFDIEKNVRKLEELFIRCV